MPEAGASRASRKYQQLGESSDRAGKKDRRQNCETLSCFINLHVLYIQKQVGQFDQTGVSNTLAWIVTWHIICLLTEICVCKEKKTVCDCSCVYVEVFITSPARKHPISCQNAPTKSSEP